VIKGRGEERSGGQGIPLMNTMIATTGKRRPRRTQYIGEKVKGGRGGRGSEQCWGKM